MEVIATGRLTTYPGKSSYQIVIDNLEPAGAGALMALLEERKKRLAAEGLFDKARKRPLPYMPKVIGVVTSPTGAVIRDIIHRIKDRFPLHVVVWPVRVQGETSGAEVAAAVTGFNMLPAGGPVPDSGRDHRGARRRQPGGPLGFQRRSSGKNRGGLGHSCHLGCGTRDRLDADRLRGGHARADADGRRRVRRACQGRTRSDAGQPFGAAEGLHIAQLRTQAYGAEGGRSRPALARTSCWRCPGAASTRRRAGSDARSRSRPNASGRGSVQRG